MSNDKMSFKIILNEKNVEPEIRRFVIGGDGDGDVDVDMNLKFFRRQIWKIFRQRLSGDADFKLTWC